MPRMVFYTHASYDKDMDKWVVFHAESHPMGTLVKIVPSANADIARSFADIMHRRAVEMYVAEKTARGDIS